MVAPKGVSTCRSKSLKDVWIERTYYDVVASGSLKGKILQMGVVEDFESRPHSFLCGKKREEIKEPNEQKLPKVLPGYSGGRLPGRSTNEKGREEGKVDEEGEERGIRGQIVQEVVAGIKEKVSVHDGEKDDVKGPFEQSFMRSWDCSQIENEEEEESWREGDQMAAQWDEEQKLEDILERRRMAGSSLQLEVMRKVPELVVHERVSQGQGVNCFREKKKVSGWSMEEVRESQILLCGGRR